MAAVTDSFYNDEDAVHNTEYCYYVVANYGELGDSQPTETECGMWEILSPDEVFAVGEDGVIYLTWTDPPAGGSGGIGGDCELVDYYGNEVPGFIDCAEQCIDIAFLDSMTSFILFLISLEDFVFLIISVNLEK